MFKPKKTIKQKKVLISCATVISSMVKVEVRQGHEIPLDNLNKYLAAHVLQFSAPITGISQYEGGQSNPTYCVKDSKNVCFVLRKKPPGTLLASAHQVEREYRIMNALKNTPVPVPRCYCLCTDESVIGTPFFVMEHIKGRVLKNPSLPDFTPRERTAIYHSMITVLAELHNIQWSKINLEDFGRQGNYYNRQISRWSRQFKASQTQPIPEMDFLIDWLPKNIPTGDETTIVHGDFRLENMMVHPTEPRVIALLDWELSTLGHPLADLGYTLLPYHIPMMGPVVGEVSGVPSEQDYVSRYCKLTQRPTMPNMNFYLSFSLFRSAAIFQGVMKRHELGNASSSNAGSFGNLAGLFAGKGVELARKCSTNNLSASACSGTEGANIFVVSKRAQAVIKQLETFVEEIIIPNESVFFSQIRKGEDRWKYYPEIMEEMKKQAKAAGLWNLWLPKEAEFGPGFTNLEYASMAEVMGRSHIAPEVFNCSAPDTGNMEVLYRYGTKEQQDKYLKPLLAGDIRSCFGMTEPDVASSDARNIETNIRHDGNNYVINGKKWYISGAGDPRCTFCILMGKTDSNAQPYRQQSMILVPMSTEGVTIVRPCNVLGFDDAPHGHMEITFNNVVVPKENILLGEGRGFEIAQGRLGPGRIHHCMRLIGLAERALRELCKRAVSRVAFGKHLARHGTIQADIANSRVEIEQCRLLTLKAAHMIDTFGAKEARGIIAMIKVAAPSMACRVVDRAMQVHGAKGLSQDTFLAHAYAGARSLRFADGPDEVHRLSIARMELKPYIGNAKL